MVLAAPVRAAQPGPFGSALRWPLAGEARELRGGFGEPREGHFHGGLDLSTGRQVGAEVLAPQSGWVERVHASGVGYGRSLYIRTTDGRLIVFGHLDAYEPALAAYVDSVQCATGDYEQDLWLPAGRFPCRPGDRMAWSGQSGAGPPHLHVEVRRSDFALSPLLAGLGVPDSLPPTLDELVLEPLDERSWVGRAAAPLVYRPRAREDTLLVEGHVRLTMRASDLTNQGRGLPVHALGARWNGAWVECRMDSISWAGEMSQIDWLIDGGRVVGHDGVILDAPPRFRPRFLTSSRPESLAVDLVSVAAGDPPRALVLWARDAAGHEVTKRVWLRGPRPAELGPDTTDVQPVARPRRVHGRVVKRAPAAEAEARWSFAELPEQRVRVRVTGTPAGLRDVRIERGGSRPELMGGAPACWDGGGWTTVLYANGTPDPDGFWIKGRLADGHAWWRRGTFALWPTSTPMVARLEDWAWFVVEPSAAYEPGVVMVGTDKITDLAAGATGVRAALVAEPAVLPLKKPVWVTLQLPKGIAPDRIGICRRDAPPGPWEWNDATWDSSSATFRTETSRLGEFALVRDEAPPEVTIHPAPRRVPVAPYPRWELTAHAVDRTSGIARRESGFKVDGTRVPTEWDPEAGVLRWRPRVPPRPGTHKVEVLAVDHAGNRTVRHGTFVIASR